MEGKNYIAEIANPVVSNWTIPVEMVIACFFSSPNLVKTDIFKEDVIKNNYSNVRKVINWQNEETIHKTEVKKAGVRYVVPIDVIISFAENLVFNSSFYFHQASDSTIKNVICTNKKMKECFEVMADSIIYNGRPISVNDFYHHRNDDFNNVIERMKKCADYYLENIDFHIKIINEQEVKVLK